MSSFRSIFRAAVFVHVGLFLLAGCGDDEPTRPNQPDPGFAIPVIEAPDRAVAGTVGLIASIARPADEITYTWKIEGGRITSDSRDTSIVFDLGEGPISVLRVVAQNAAGDAKSAEHPIEVLAAQDETIHAPDHVTEGRDDVTASVTVREGASYEWTIDGGTIASGQGTASISFTVTATDVVHLAVQVTRADGTPSEGARTLAVVAPPDARLTAPTAATQGAVGLEASVPNQPASTYNWTIVGGVVTGGDGSPAVTFDAGHGASALLTAVVTNAAGDSASMEHEIRLVPPANATISAPAKVLKGQENVQVSVPAQDGATYAWTVSDGTITSTADGHEIAFTADYGDTVSVAVVVSNAGGTSDSSLVQIPTSWGFSALVGTMSSPRMGAKAVALQDGRVLVAGGQAAASGQPLASAEIYSATGGFTATASMAETRVHHTMTLLQDGRVLVLGGLPSLDAPATTAHGSVEIFDPVTETWTSMGPMGNPRHSHTATLLLDGRGLVVGGVGRGGSGIRSAEVLDLTRGWSLVNSPPEARSHHTATLLEDGKVFVAGNLSFTERRNGELLDTSSSLWTLAVAGTPLPWGMSGARLPFAVVMLSGGVDLLPPSQTETTVATARFYDPPSNSFHPVTSMNVARSNHTSYPLSNGWVVAAGGVDVVPASAHFYWEGVRSVELYDPYTDSWHMAENLLEARVEPAAAVLPDGRLFIAGGYVDEARTVVLSNAEIFTPAQ